MLLYVYRQIICYTPLHIAKKWWFLCYHKMFDLIHINTLQLLYILRLCYNEVYINKPVTSRSTNSEKYIICKGYKRNNNIIITITEILLSYQLFLYRYPR